MESMAMKIGYARVSTEEQNLDLQLNALTKAGCRKIHQDKGLSGAVRSRPGLEDALSELKTGDTLVVWKLDRLGRSLVHLVETINSLSQRGIEFSSLTEKIETVSPSGRLVFHLMAAMAEFERSLISERTRAGMQAAKAKGTHLGRRPALNFSQQKEICLAINLEREAIPDVAERYGVHPRTIRRVLEKQ